MDYYEIGTRVRRMRRARELSQEQLAEAVGISVTHMSHIETGNTKLSLPVLVELARALDVQTDALLYDKPESLRGSTTGEILRLLENCTPQELLILEDVLKAVKTSLRQHRM